ncbi:acyl-CoA dehydrogenase [Algoriphagus sp. AGSA1]|uniref:acyl-CoA dehydrogenase n=1 Tax=Algoriphagus sp. AGSA1 TaxID=2907213 RepID=UPI001F32B2CF|nr:acyl-CoA dehydrogenase [Algoriphagus sp. AGSA1]MCE7056062.1 acyl-CoA dehydrogenase [Algoriphagus sp. AGSA1]
MKNPDLFHHELASKAENLGHLPGEWLEKIYNEKWFKLFVPKDLGGLGCTLPEALKIEEKLAKLDGSLGWTVTLCAGAAWFVGFMEESLRNDIFPDTKLCLAGSGFVGGKANLVGNKYSISGSWTYASGALHATHLTANCEIFEEGNAVLDKKGEQVVKAFLLDRNDVEILDGWNYMGMIATGSHAFSCENLEAPINRCFEILPEKALLTDSVYQYPFLQFAEVTLAANILGISLHMKELIEQSFWRRHEYREYDKKHLKYFRKLLSKQEEKLKEVRHEFYHQVNASWDELEKNGVISDSRLEKVSRISRKLTQKCRAINSKLYPFAGLEAAKTHTELNRVWRDFNTVSQHALLIFPF